jgi:hypothetical protein
LRKGCRACVLQNQQADSRYIDVAARPIAEPANNPAPMCHGTKCNFELRGFLRDLATKKQQRKQLPGPPYLA